MRHLIKSTALNLDCGKISDLQGKIELILDRMGLHNIWYPKNPRALAAAQMIIVVIYMVIYIYI